MRGEDYLLMFDSNYYLGDIRRGELSSNAMLAITTQLFFPVPGQYRLPYNEGNYVVDDGKISYLTMGAGKTYEHPLVVPETDVMTLISTGWLSRAWGFMKADSYA